MRKRLSVADYIQGIQTGNGMLLSKAITLVESVQPQDEVLAREILSNLALPTTETLRIAITGSPGVGKSTFIEGLGLYITGQNQKVAVLTVDPSSEESKGSILGDKTRMEKLSVSENAFIRTSPSSNHLGGVTPHTGQSILLCEAAGYGNVLIETVGTGQSETDVAKLSDVFILLLQPGSGDDLQAIKKGVMETADMIIIHKADGDQASLAEKARNEILHSLPLHFKETPRPVLTFSSLYDVGFDRVWNQIMKLVTHARQQNTFESRRVQGDIFLLREQIKYKLIHQFMNDKQTQDEIVTQGKQRHKGQISLLNAADQVMKSFFKKNSDYGG